MESILRWIGGKKQSLKYILPLVPQDYRVYCEPFIGGGAVFWSLEPSCAIINDKNNELINVYNCVKQNLSDVLSILSTYKNEKDFYYSIRNLDRDKEKFNSLTDSERAARFLYLNKTCFNALYRVNSKGQNNAAFGYKKSKNFFNTEQLTLASSFLNSARISISSIDYESILDSLPNDSFCYLDPPYDATFDSYLQGGFNKTEQERLRDNCDKLTKRGINFLLSNSNTDFIRQLYRDYTCTEIYSNRVVNSKGTERGAVKELLISNY